MQNVITEEQSIDRRRRKTREAIKSAVVELISEQDISKISAKAIAERADINRSTFYMHYTDVYSVLESIQDDAANTIAELADVVNINNIDDNLRLLFAKVTERLDSRPGFLKFLIDNKTGFYERIENKLIARLMTECTALFPKADPDVVFDAVSFIVCGLFGAYSHWIATRTLPLDEFCDCMVSIMDKGLMPLVQNGMILKK